MGHIPDHALKNLKKYSYKGVDKSLVSNYVLHPYWNYLVTLWPKTVAPNTITLTGLIIVILNFMTLIYYDPTYLTEKEMQEGDEMPRWIFYTWALGLFLYQSLDAIDGKQARRTGMAGPLGELFDHGCDALNTTLEVMLSSYALNLGRSWWTVASQVATLANFYLTTWEEYHTGQLYLGVFSGPVEGILMVICIFIVSGAYGPSFWDTGILTFFGVDHVPFLVNTFPNLPLNESFMVFGGFGLAFNIFTSYNNVHRARSSSGKGTMKPLLHLLPYVASVAVHVAWLSAPSPVSKHFSLTKSFHDNPPSNLTHANVTTPNVYAYSMANSAILHSPLIVPFLCAWGLQFAHQVGRMILAHITSTPLPFWNPMWLVVGACAIDANARLLFGCDPYIQSSPSSIQACVYLVLTLSLVTYVQWCMAVIGDITNYLGIACFTVRKRDKEGVWRQGSEVLTLS